MYRSETQLDQLSTTPMQSMDICPEPDLYPLQPTVAQLSTQISSHSGLTPRQKAKLVAHCLTRSCVFGDLAILQFLLNDPQAQTYADLGFRDEDGVGLITLTVHGFGGDPDRDIEREECVRLLASQGADLSADKAGWTPLHYAALLAPPTLISYLLTHGCSPFSRTERRLTPLDIVTAHSVLPGREGVALLLDEAMRGQGWKGGHMDEKRRQTEQRNKTKRRRQQLREDVGKDLGLVLDWWGGHSDFSDSESDSDEDEYVDENVYTPRLDYSSMLVFSPSALPQIFDSLITNYRPRVKDATPANTLYLLARFAALTCDHTWLEDLLVGAADAIEETFFSQAEDLSCLVFWLYNTTLWLHLLQCDNSIREACEMLDSFELIEEAINSVFVFIIRYAEQRIDQLLEAAVLSYTPSPAEFEAVQFQSDWSFLRSFTSKKKAGPPSPKKSSAASTSPSTPTRPLSPAHNQASLSSSTSRGFSSLRETISRARGQSSTIPLSAIFQEAPPTSSPLDLINFFTSLHMLLVLSDINPAIIMQLWSQVMYWTSCEIFNRTITRKKYLCRSRAVQIAVNLTAIYQWIEDMGLPMGIHNHFAPVRDLFNWLQRLSSITEFSDLVETIQSMKNMNPLQMRRAVRDYKYEVNENRMTDECIQYLTQLQKDWERHRVKLGVEAIRKEISERDRERDSVSPFLNELAASADSLSPHQSIDVLFDKTFDKSLWEPARPPQALGELLDSRFMIPLLFPSDPRLLAALPGKQPARDEKRSSLQTFNHVNGTIGGSNTSLPWRTRNRKIREVGVHTLRWLDGAHSAARWGRPVAQDYEPEDVGHDKPQEHLGGCYEAQLENANLQVNTHLLAATPLTRRPSGRAKKRHSIGEITPIDAIIDKGQLSVLEQ